MNAIITLCHFCEAHGPASIFCTQTLRNTKIDNLDFDAQQIPNKLCAACNSLGKSTGIVSQDETSNAIFVSSQTPIFTEVSLMVKQASVRSLSCEITSIKDGGFVFFGDAARGHVLSHTFHVSDMQARGFYQLFSIIILMKDKFFLLNIQPFLAEHLKKISEKLQSLAKKVTEEEQSRMSARDLRLSGNVPNIPSTPRSLIDLTKDDNIFAIIHSHFTWILMAGSRRLTEQIGNLPWTTINNSSETSKQIEQEIKTKSLDEDEGTEELYSLRRMKEILKTGFVGTCFCVITGIKIIIRGPPDKTEVLLKCFKNLLPLEMHKVIQNDPKFITDSEYRIISVLPEIAVPMPSSLVFRIDFLEENQKVSVRWLGELPQKMPDFLLKILKAVEEPLFNNFVLNKHIQVLIEEWKNKFVCIKKIKSTSDQVKLKKILSIQQQDQVILNYWIRYL